MKRILLHVTVLTGVLFGCSTLLIEQPKLHQNSSYYNYIQPSFELYQARTRKWLNENRQFISKDIESELIFNTPFYLPPQIETDKAVLLVHGLGDSPFYFSDLAKTLSNANFHVYTLLLPGHGSKPVDLMLPNYQDWQHFVDHYTKILTNKHRNVWLGGFSTGGNIVTIAASQNSDINGLLLFSPGFQSKAGVIEKLTPIAAMFSDWGWKTTETNIARYNSTTFNGAMAYIDSASEVRARLSQVTVKIPTLLVLSAADSVVDPFKTHEIFAASFENNQNQVIWYGSGEGAPSGVEHKSMKLPETRISTGSHMGMLFSPDNPYYGVNGSKRICENGFNKEHEKKCEQGAKTWFSAWGYEEKGKIHARLTWNPYYKELESKIVDFVK